MDKSIIQLVDELPTDNITVKVLKALDFVAPGEWNNLVGFDNSIRTITGETDPKVVQRIRDRAVALYHDPKQGYETAIKLYQMVDKADAAMGAAALANKVGEKISFLSFLNNITPKANVTQSIDLVLKITVEIIAYCKLNGIPQANPVSFANSLGSNYHNASLMRMVALVCLDGILPLGPDFAIKLQSIIAGADASIITQNPVFQSISTFIPGSNTVDKLGFMNQGFNSTQGWMSNLVSKTGVTPESIFSHVGSFIQLANDNLDFVAAFLDQSTNYYEHTGIQTVAYHLITQAHTLIKEEIQQEKKKPLKDTSKTISSNDNEYEVGQKVEVWDGEEEDWYKAKIKKIKDGQYFVDYDGYDSSHNEWVDEDDIRTLNSSSSDKSRYAVGQKVKVWDEDEEEWYSATIEKAKGKQYFVHYVGYGSSYDEWVGIDDIS